MAKKLCVNCGKELGFLSLKTQISDGVVCTSCLSSAGISTLGNPAAHDTTSIRALIADRKQFANSFNPTKKVSTTLMIDETNKLFKVNNDIFAYDNLLDYELLEDGESISKGGLGRAVAGGLLFGGVGAIVGGVTGGKKTKGICTSLKLKITLKKAHCDNVYINFINTETKTSGFVYKTMKESAEACVSALQIIADEMQTSANSSNESISVVQPISSADEILKFKTLLDQGIITQDEFNKKKAELLGL